MIHPNGHLVELLFCRFFYYYFFFPFLFSPSFFFPLFSFFTENRYEISKRGTENRHTLPGHPVYTGLRLDVTEAADSEAQL